MRRSFFAVCGLVVLVTPPTVGSQAGSGAANTDPVPRQHAAIGAPQIRHAIRDKVNNGLVSIVSGSLDATDLTEVTDLASSLDGMRDLRYKMYDQEVHILAGREINSIADLASKKVNFGVRDSGSNLTANVIFRALGITLEPTSFPSPSRSRN